VFMAVKLRIAIVYAEFNNYLHACWSALAAREDAEVWVGSLGKPLEGAKLFHKTENGDDSRLHVEVFGSGKDTQSRICSKVAAFQPDVYVGYGWRPSLSMKIARHFKRIGVRTIGCADTPWLGTAKQAARCVLGGAMIRGAYDAIMIPGARGVPIARLLGFADSRIWQNLYSGNSDVFSAGTEERLKSARFRKEWPQRFVFVGRLVEVKNMRGLIAGYELYRKRSKDPWPLTIIGDGPQKEEAQGRQGVECLGWLDGSEIARQLASSGVFVLPSFYEPWGVVVHEAACCGLPLMLSLDVGAGSDLLRDGFNGRFFDAKNPTQIAQMMLWFSNHPCLWELGQRSFEMSSQFSPTLWAENVVTRSLELLQSNARS
jgi:glycosyltransferase involved in cell wall biosynthesis